jgi:hypothetical protein
MVHEHFFEEEGVIDGTPTLSIDISPIINLNVATGLKVITRATETLQLYPMNLYISPVLNGIKVIILITDTHPICPTSLTILPTIITIKVITVLVICLTPGISRTITGPLYLLINAISASILQCAT